MEVSLWVAQKQQARSLIGVKVVGRQRYSHYLHREALGSPDLEHWRLEDLIVVHRLRRPRK